jgi:hypothetical protein
MSFKNREGIPLKLEYFGLNYLLLQHSLAPSVDPRTVVGPVNIDLKKLNVLSTADDDPVLMTQDVADATAEEVADRLGGCAGKILAVCVMPFYFRRPLWQFPPSNAAAWATFNVMSKPDSEASIVISTTSRVWNDTSCTVTGHPALSIPMKLRSFDDKCSGKFMDRSRYAEIFAAHGKGVNPFFLRMSEIFTQGTWNTACPLISAEIARRAYQLMIE